MKYGLNILKQLALNIIKNYVILLSFFLPVIILEAAYISRGVFPFGTRNILMVDLYHQYAPFISDLQDKYKSLSGLIYSWTSGLGTYYLPIFAYYLASPLNLLIVFFPKEYLCEAILLLTLLKIGLAGSFFALYLKGIHHEQSLETVVFSLLYALSGYVLVFSWNIMWLDSIYLLPLLVLGLHRLVRDSKGFFFGIVLAITFLSNFYIAFFICLFLFLYYPVLLFKYNCLKSPLVLLKKSSIFAFFSILAAGLSSILLVPTYFALKDTSAASDKFPSSLTNFFDLFDYITRHFTYSLPSIREGMPNIYSGIIVLILIPIYFLSKSIRLKEKLWNVYIILILIFSFNMDILNFIWNGFHYPNQVPYRFSFLYIFLIVSLSYEGYKRLPEFSGKQVGIICFSIVGMILLSQKFEKLSLDYLTVYISIFFIIMYAASLTYDHYPNILHSQKVLFLVVVIFIEVTTNTLMTMDKIDSLEGYTSRDGYSSGTEAAQIRDQISNLNKSDQSFYRMEVLPTKTDNDPALYNYRGLSIFSSTVPFKTVKMMQNLGFPSNNINSYEYEGSTAILDSIFGIKYLIYRSLDIEENLYTKTSSVDSLKFYTNPYALPIGFQCTDNIKDFHSGYSTNALDAENRLMEDICGTKDILVPTSQKQGSHENLSIDSSDVENYIFKRKNKDIGSTAIINFPIYKSEHVYLYYTSPNGFKGNGFIMVNDKKINFSAKHSSIINLGYCNMGASVSLHLEFEKASPESGSFNIYAYTLNTELFEEAISQIKNKSMSVKSFNDTNIDGKVNLENDGQMVLTFPYDKDWHVKVDGSEVKTSAMDDCLLSFAIPKGQHSIEIKYKPQKFIIGLYISLISLFILIILLISRYFIGVRNSRRNILEVADNG